MQHTKPFKDPFRPKQKPLSDEARDKLDEIFGPHILPNEKDHLESFIIHGIDLDADRDILISILI